MPDLSALSKTLLLKSISSAIMTGRGPSKYPASALATSFIRLVDAVVCAYELARVELTDARTNRSFGSLFRAISHLEACIESLHRAVNFAEAIRRQLRDADGRAVILRPQEVEVLNRGPTHRIRDARHAIQHTDEWIQKGKISQGELHVLYCTEADITIGSSVIRFDELARWISQLQKLAERVIAYQEPPPNSSAGGDLPPDPNAP